MALTLSASCLKVAKHFIDHYRTDMKSIGWAKTIRDEVLKIMEESLEKPTVMYVCEINHLILHVNQPYIFHRHSDCSQCKEYLWEVADE